LEPQPTPQSIFALGPHPRSWIKLGFYTGLGFALLYLACLLVVQLATAIVAVCAPFVVAVCLALLMDPLVHNFERRGLSRAGSAGIVYGVFFVIFVGVLYITVPAMIVQASLFAQSAPGSIASLEHRMDIYLTTHKRWGPIPLPPNADAVVAELSNKIAGTIQNSAGGIVSLLQASVTLVIELVLTLIITFFLLLDMDRFRSRLFYLVPREHRAGIKQWSVTIGEVFTKYLRGLIIVCVLYGVGAVLLLYVMSLACPGFAKYALVVGAVAGVLYAIPYIGALAIALITFIVGFAAGGIHYAVIAVVCRLILNQIYDNIITPRIVGGGVGLHPIVAIFALVLGGNLFGFWGLLLSVPVAASIQIILFHLFPRLHEPIPQMKLNAESVDADNEHSAEISTS
jgi:predicted PurR-regulated permease PerM